MKHWQFCESNRVFLQIRFNECGAVGVVKILETKEADGVTFYRVAAPPNNFGWVQSEAVVGNFRRGDDERLARLIQASNGFDQIELAVNFSRNFSAFSVSSGDSSSVRRFIGRNCR